MSCTPFASEGPASVSAMLSAVNCATAQASALAFDHLFGNHGALLTALTGVLTIYVALLAFNLVMGRGPLSISLLAPRALGLGLALTFATSWAAYQQVVWNLAAGAPDQIAGLLIGSHGSAVELFAGQLDGLFAAVSEAAQTSAAVTTDTMRKAAPFTPSDLLWFAALLLLLGTAGVLVVARIALVALLAVGPVFILLALFGSTRGLFEGWLKAVALFAAVPLLTVLAGGGALLMLTPLIQSLAPAGNAITMQMAAGVFLGACVYCALMAMVLKAAGALTSSWRLPGASVQDNDHSRLVITAQASHPGLTSGREDERVRQIVAGMRIVAAPATQTFAEAARPALALAYCSPHRGPFAAGSAMERVRGLGAVSLPEVMP